MKTTKVFVNNDSLQVKIMSKMMITSEGKLIVLSGGESASQGGMGSGSKSGAEKGEIKNDDNTTVEKNKDADTETGNTLDPLKKEIEKKEPEK